MRRAAQLACVAAALAWPIAGHAFDSKCYQGGLACGDGPDAARSRWRGPGDEHRQLWAAAVAPLTLPPHINGEVPLQVFTSSGGSAGPGGALSPLVLTGPGALAPAPFAVADDITLRTYSIDEMAQLPDFSYALWDWVTGNDTCPIGGPLAGDLTPAADCHSFATHMGALNSSHFVPQAGSFFLRYHAIAMARAADCGRMRVALDQQSRFDQFVEACDQEAFTFEAIAHHFLQDAWSTGHMWQRWGGPDLADFPGGDGRAVAVVVSLVTGLIHGARGVLQSKIPSVDWRDPLCAPFDPTQFPVSGVNNPVQYIDDRALRTGVGDLYLDALSHDYPQQYAGLLDCERRAISDVAAAAEIGVSGVSALPESTSAAFLASCFGQRVTNESMLLGAAVDGFKFGLHGRLELNGQVAGAIDLGTTIEAAAFLPQGANAGAAVLSPSLFVQLHVDLIHTAMVVWDRTARSRFGTDLANGGMPPLLGVAPNGAYLHSPEASYVDPLPPWRVSFSDDASGATTDRDMVTANALARAFHRAHAIDWCAAATGQDLLALVVQPLQGSAASAARCEICVEIAGRHIRVGKDASDFDDSQEPLCHYLATQPAYVYAEADDDDPAHAARIFCGCDSGNDGGMDGPMDGPTDTGIDAQGGAGGSDNGGGGTSGGGADNGGGGPSGGGADNGGGGGGGGGAEGASSDDSTSAGDPHLFTWQGIHYNFQAAGELVLATDGVDRTIQVRQAPIDGSRSIARNRGVATRVGARRITYELGAGAPILLDGVPMIVPRTVSLPEGTIAATASSLIVSWSNGDRLSVIKRSDWLDIKFFVPRNTPRVIDGLLGGTRDSLFLRDGTAILPRTRAELYEQFGNSWRITQAESLFDYGPGESTATFTDLEFPYATTSTAQLDVDVYEAAQASCAGAGITDPSLLDDCALDLAVTGDPASLEWPLDVTPPQLVLSADFYRTDFESGADPNLWFDTRTAVTPGTAMLPPTTYLGPFTTETVALFLDRLPPHTEVTTNIDFYIFGPGYAPGGQLYHETKTYADSSPNFTLSLWFQGVPDGVTWGLDNVEISLASIPDPPPSPP